MTLGFQQTVNLQPAPAAEGDFASLNPFASTLIGAQGGYVSGTPPVTVGKFAWGLGTGLTGGCQIGGDIGFVHNGQQGLIDTFVGNQVTLTIPSGRPATAMKMGDLWARFAAGATPQQKVYADFLDGTPSAAATATPTTATGTVSTATNTTLTVTAAPSFPIAIGQPVSGSGIASGTVISAFGTGAGGIGTYTLSLATTATATGVTATFTKNVETNWYVRSTAAAGEVAIISTFA